MGQDSGLVRVVEHSMVAVDLYRADTGSTVLRVSDPSNPRSAKGAVEVHLTPAEARRLSQALLSIAAESTQDRDQPEEPGCSGKSQGQISVCS